MRLDISQKGFPEVGLNLHDMEALVQGGFPIKHLDLQVKSNTNCRIRDGQFITITKTVAKPRTEPAYIGTIYAIALGCDAKYLKEICYTERLTSEKFAHTVPMVFLANPVKEVIVNTGQFLQLGMRLS